MIPELLAYFGLRQIDKPTPHERQGQIIERLALENQALKRANTEQARLIALAIAELRAKELKNKLIDRAMRY